MRRRDAGGERHGQGGMSRRPSGDSPDGVDLPDRRGCAARIDAARGRRLFRDVRREARPARRACHPREVVVAALQDGERADSAVVRKRPEDDLEAAGEPAAGAASSRGRRSGERALEIANAFAGLERARGEEVRATGDANAQDETQTPADAVLDCAQLDCARRRAGPRGAARRVARRVGEPTDPGRGRLARSLADLAALERRLAAVERPGDRVPRALALDHDGDARAVPRGRPQPRRNGARWGRRNDGHQRCVGRTFGHGADDRRGLLDPVPRRVPPASSPTRTFGAKTQHDARRAHQAAARSAATRPCANGARCQRWS